jgi:hypothetical protein
MARWQLGDLLAGASDLSAYDFCKKMGWEFYICTNFHGKIFSLPPNGILVGSANATNAGLGLLPNSNSELCTVVEESTFNAKIVEDLIKSSKRMTDELYSQMKSVYLHLIESNNTSLVWPDAILKEISPSVKYEGKLFLSECLASNGDEILVRSQAISYEAQSDASLLSLPSERFDRQVIAQKFQQTKIYQLLLGLLEREGGEVYFGALTAMIHNRLMEDPAPHRSDIKRLVQNLYSWVTHLGEEFLSMSVDRPNHSERIRII